MCHCVMLKDEEEEEEFIFHTNIKQNVNNTTKHKICGRLRKRQFNASRLLLLYIITQPSLGSRIKCCTPSVCPSVTYPDFLEIGKP